MLSFHAPCYRELEKEEDILGQVGETQLQPMWGLKRQNTVSQISGELVDDTL